MESVTKTKPHYADILGFYGRLFVAQEESKNRVRLDPYPIPDDVRIAKAEKKRPLIEIEEFTYDRVESADLFVAIAELAGTANPHLARSAAVLLEAGIVKLKSEALFSAFLNGDEAFFETLAEAHKIEKQILGFITYNSLKPSLCTGAAQLSGFLSDSDPWLKGDCPVCGSAPTLAILDADGARSLVCGFCWHIWTVRREMCPYCEHPGQTERHYFFDEKEKEFRVYLCGNCNKYLKTIDARQADRMIYPPLEQVLTLHLDYKAREEGFEPGIALSALL